MGLVLLYLQCEIVENILMVMGILCQVFSMNIYISGVLVLVFGELVNLLFYVLFVELGIKLYFLLIELLIIWVEVKFGLDEDEVEVVVCGIQCKIGCFGILGYGMVCYVLIDGCLMIEVEFVEVFVCIYVCMVGGEGGVL